MLDYLVYRIDLQIAEELLGATRVPRAWICSFSWETNRSMFVPIADQATRQMAGQYLPRHALDDSRRDS